MRIPWIPFLIILFYHIPLKGQKLEYKQGEILIEITKGSNPISLKKTYATFNGRFSDIKLTQICSEPMNIWKISFDHNVVNEFKFIDDIALQPSVKAVQPNYIFKPRLIPNDPRFSQQWQYINDGSNGGIEGIDTDAEIAWDITTGGLTTSGDTIVVAVIDNGVDDMHEDLQPNIWVNRFEIPDNGADDDNNGYIDDYRGWDAIEGDDNITRDGGHGTSVTGLVGALGNNGIGVTGVNWTVKLMIIRGGSFISDAIGSYAYIYAQRKRYNDSNGSEGAYVVATNASWGFDNKFEEDAPMLCEFYDMLGEIGIVSAASTANNNTNVDLEGDLPTNCSSPYLISVTNMTKVGIKKSNAGFGIESIDLAAPGDQVVTTSRGDNYTTFAGTSASSPLVAGVAGLIYATPCSTISNLSKTDPAEAASLVRNLILGSITQNENLLDLTSTGGHLNIGNAVILANNLCDTCPPPEDVQSTINTSTIDVSWNSPGDAETDIRYREKGNLAWKRALAVTSPFEIPNLNECTFYEVQLRSSCNESGPYSHTYYYQTDNCCKNPDSFNVSVSDDVITASWDKVTAAENYILEFKEVPNTTWSSITTSDNKFDIPNLNSCSGFEFRLSTDCGSETIPFSFPINSNTNCDNCVNAGFCDVGFMDNAFEFIESVSIGDHTFQSGINTKGYGSYIGNTGIVLLQGDSVEVSINPGFVQGTFSENAAIFFDWDQDGIFEMSEMEFSPTGFTNTVFGKIKVRSNALPGLTRMRVVLSFEDIEGPCTSDGLEVGEIEDYCITIQSIQSCDNPVTIENINAKSTSISLLWSSVSEAEDYTLDYRMEGAGEWNSMVSLAAFTNISDLTKCTSYEIRVKANCSGMQTNFSPIKIINTRCGTSVIDPNGNINNYQITPNPFINHVTMEISSPSNYSEVKITVYDLKGYKKMESIMDYNNGKLILSNLDILQSGIYLISASTTDFTIIEKMIKL